MHVGDLVVCSAVEASARHFGAYVTTYYCSVYSSYASGALPTVCATLESGCLEMGTDTYFVVYTGGGPPTDYGIGAATGEMVTTGDNACSH